MIFSYADLKGKIKVGDRVRAVKGKFNPCNELEDDGSDEMIITFVSDNYFETESCIHSFDGDDVFLDRIDYKKTLEDAEAGDVLVDKDGVLTRA